MVQESQGEILKFSNVVTLKDIITFVSIIVAMTMAWGVFGTRLTIVERELVYQSKTIDQQQKQLDDLKMRQDRLESRIRDDEYTIQSMWNRRK